MARKKRDPKQFEDAGFVYRANKAKDNHNKKDYDNRDRQWFGPPPSAYDPDKVDMYWIDDQEGHK